MQNFGPSVPLLIPDRINSWNWGLGAKRTPSGGSFRAQPAGAPRQGNVVHHRSSRCEKPDDQTDHQAPCGSFDPDLARLSRDYEHALGVSGLLTRTLIEAHGLSGGWPE